jgi:Galactose oxidase, central domain
MTSKVAVWFGLLGVTALPSAWAQYSGMGASTLACIDKDGDGYGTGKVAVAFTDLAIDATNNKLVTSASHVFTQEDRMRSVVISAGTGFTPGSYVVDTISGSGAVLFSSPGTVGSSGGSYSMPGCLGVDADDTDPSVHTGAQALSKWGSVAGFYAHLGALHGEPNYYAKNGSNGIQRYWTVAASGGNDSTCTAHTFAASPDPLAVTACATINHVDATLVAGDMVILLAGTHTPGLALWLITDGTANNPISYINYPGADVLIDFAGAGGFTLDARSYILFDGIRILNSSNAAISGGSAYGGPPYLTTGPSRFVGNRLRNLNIFYGQRGMLIMDGISDLIIEDSMIGSQYPGGGTHNIYLGGRSNPSDTVKVRRNILYGSGDQVGTGVQFNGRVTNLLVESNLIWGNGLACVSLEQGVSNSIVRNNSCWDNKRGGLVLFDYFAGGVDGDATCYNGSGHVDASGTFGICPHAQTGNLWENNTVYMGQFDAYGNAISGMPCVDINDSTSTGPHDFSGNTFRNNICQNYDGWFISTHGSESAASLATLTLDKNIFFSTSGAVGSEIMRDFSGSGDVRYTWAQLTTLYGSGNVSGNISSNPLFTILSTWNAPQTTDLRLQPGSPGINTGSTTSAPANDVLGHNRTVTPSIGAYQYASGGTALPLNTWVTLATHGKQVQSVGWEKMRYARPIKRFVFQGDYHIDNNEPNNALVMFDFERAWWHVLSTTGLFKDEMMPEAGHQDGFFTWDSTRNVFASVCCMTYGRQAENPYWTWWYDPVGQVGRAKHTTPWFNALAGQQGTMAYDSTHDRIVLWGVGTGETWTYNPATNVWTKQSAIGTEPPNGLQLASMSFNPDDGKVYLFGGQWGGVTRYNDVYTYDVPSNTWTNLTISGTKPTGRYEVGWDYDTTNHKFLAFGGYTDDATTHSLEAWAFDPVALTWEQKASVVPDSGTGAIEIFERLAYDPDHNVFVAPVVGNGSGIGNDYATDARWALSIYPIQTWMFRLGGVGPAIGALTTSDPAPTAGSLNHYTGSWAQQPAIAADGSGNIAAAWSEFGAEADGTNYMAHVAVSGKAGAGAWTSMGTGHTALNGDTVSGCSNIEGHDPHLAYISGTVWISDYAGCEQENSVYLKSWGSSWTGTAVGKVNPFSITASLVRQGRNALTAVGTTPTVAFIETEYNVGNSQEQLAFVKSCPAGSCSTLGSFLNRDRGPAPTTPCNLSGCSKATSVSIASNGTVPLVAFTEYVSNNNGTDTAPKLYVSQWNSGTSSWDALGGAINTAGTWAQDASIAYMGSQPYVAWVERTQSGPAQVFVKTYSGGVWSLVGAGTRNKDTSTGWAFKPSLATDGTSLYLGWVEQQAIAQKAKLYVDKWSSSAWSSTASGSALNMAAQGSAQGAVLAVDSGQPLATWSEVNFGGQRQVYAAKYTGSSWSTLPGTVVCAIAPNTLGAWTVGQAPGSVMTASNCGAGTITWTSSGLPAGLSGCNSVTGTTCTLSGTLTTANSYTPTISVSDGGSNTASINPTVIVNAAPSITSSGALTAGTVGTPYSQALSTSGGTGSLTCSVVSGSLPVGTSFSGCTIMGTPTTANTYSFTAHATDSNGITGATSASLSILINSSGLPSSVTSGTVTRSGSVVVH